MSVSISPSEFRPGDRKQSAVVRAFPATSVKVGFQYQGRLEQYGYGNIGVLVQREFEDRCFSANGISAKVELNRVNTSRTTQSIRRTKTSSYKAAGAHSGARRQTRRDVLSGAMSLEAAVSRSASVASPARKYKVNQAMLIIPQTIRVTLGCNVLIRISQLIGPFLNWQRSGRYNHGDHPKTAIEIRQLDGWSRCISGIYSAVGFAGIEGKRWQYWPFPGGGRRTKAPKPGRADRWNLPGVRVSSVSR